MLQSPTPLAPMSSPGASKSEPGSLEHTVSTAVEMVRRRYPVMVFTLIVCVFLATLYVLTAPIKYTSTAVLLIDSRRMQGLQTQSSQSTDIPIDSVMVDSQVEILRSESIASAVIKDLRLLGTAEFVGPQGGLLGAISGLLASFLPESTPTEQQLMQRAVGRFANQLTIKRIPQTYVIEISFQSLSRDQATRIANAVADGYILDSLESKYQASRRAAVWLQDRLKELRAQASAAERTVADYKAKNNIVDAGGRLLTEQQLAELNSALTVARNQRAEAQAKLERITAILNADDNDTRVIVNDLAAVNDSMANPIITKLRQTYLDYSARSADWSNRYGPTHLAVVNLRNQMREIRKSIIDELRRTAESYKSDLEIAKAREEASQKSLNDTIAVSNDTSQAQIVLRDLESNAQSARALSDNFLQLYMVSVQQQSFPITEARVITQASPPPSKSSPKTLLILLASIVAGSVFAGIIAKLMDMMDRTFKTTMEVERLLGVSCLTSVPALNPSGDNTAARKLLGFLPKRIVAPAPEKPRFGAEETATKDPNGQVTLDRNNGVAANVLDAPFSRFAESFRSIKLAVDLSAYSRPNTVIGITSALPNEGKSTVSEALALVTAQSGLKTLLIDGDIRNPSLTDRLAPNAETGLLEVVLGRVDWSDAILRDSITNLHFLPCATKSRLSNSSDLLASPQMLKLFAELRQNYDRVILDLSPLAPIIDVRATGGLVDGYILVVEWARSKIDVVERSLSDAPAVHSNLIGAVLNKVNVAVMSRYDHYTGGYYRNRYYHRYGYLD